MAIGADMTLLGTSIIGRRRGQSVGAGSHGVNPATGATLEPTYFSPSEAEVTLAIEFAAQAAPVFGNLPGQVRAEFLRVIAGEIEARADEITLRAMEETGLPEARIKGETARTCGQLRLFAALLDEGSWAQARIDHGDPNRSPLPKPDVRSVMRPVGPVAVFCASNFPLAFSVAGGDTASALAAGCPVVAKAHSSHPGTAELAGCAIQAAAEKCGMPEGVFSLLYGGGRDVGQKVVSHPAIKAVGFTGSRAGGRALMDLAAARPEPIPVYAEMSSINPVFILPGAMSSRATALAAGLHGSVTMGVGQFCTNPGLVILDSSGDVATFQAELVRLIAGTVPAAMLNATICQAYQSGTERLSGNARVRQLAAAPAAGGSTGSAALYETTVKEFLADPSLAEELFGPSTLLVLAKDRAEMIRLAESLEGQLTATVHGTDEEIVAAGDLLGVLQQKAGRLLCNGFPTGVEVCHAMVHGGPYPATADGRSTSVGTQAIYRFVRAVCFQNFPAASLPAELQEANPLNLLRLVDSEWKR